MRAELKFAPATACQLGAVPVIGCGVGPKTQGWLHDSRRVKRGRPRSLNPTSSRCPSASDHRITTQIQSLPPNCRHCMWDQVERDVLMASDGKDLHTYVHAHTTIHGSMVRPVADVDHGDLPASSSGYGCRSGEAVGWCGDVDGRVHFLSCAMPGGRRSLQDLELPPSSLALFLSGVCF